MITTPGQVDLAAVKARQQGAWSSGDYAVVGTTLTQAHAEAIAPFRQTDGSYRIKATFRCLLAQP